MDTYHLHLSKSTEHTTPRVKPQDNYGVSVITTCWCWLTSCSEHTTLVRNFGNRGNYECAGWRVFGKSLYLPLNFAMNFKKLLKNSLNKKKAQKEILSHYNMDEHGQYYPKWNKADVEGKILLDISYRWNLKKSNTQKQRIEWWFLRPGSQRIEWWVK